MWLLAAALVLAALAFFGYGALRGGREFFHHVATYGGTEEKQP